MGNDVESPTKAGTPLYRSCRQGEAEGGKRERDFFKTALCTEDFNASSPCGKYCETYAKVMVRRFEFSSAYSPFQLSNINSCCI